MTGYVKFEMPAEVIPKILELLSNVGERGKIKKGVNETTKSIERRTAKLVVIAENVNPEEIVIHIPLLCEENDIPFAYVKTKEDLGKAVGLIVGTTSVSVEDAGAANEALQDVLKRLPKTGAKEAKKASEVEKKVEEPKEKKRTRKEKKAEKS